MYSLIGLLVIAVGSFGQSSSYVPIKRIRKWSWENFWLVQGVFSWLILPLIGACLVLPAGTGMGDVWRMDGAVEALVYGALWGVGSLTFGLSMKYLGVALGQSLALGTCAAFGTLLPLLLRGESLFSKEYALLLTGVCISLVGIFIIGYAGHLRSKLLEEKRKMKEVQSFSLVKGVVIALISGITGACFALGLEAGGPIKEMMLANGCNGLFAGLPVVFLVTFGGLFTNMLYCVVQNIRNYSAGEYLSVKKSDLLNNIMYCLLAGVLWYSQFFGLEVGKDFLKESPVLLSFSWSILMSLNVIFSNLWGIILSEWKGCDVRTIATLIIGLIVLIVSICLVAVA